MYAADGVGLAAGQFGVDLAVFCFHCHDSTGEYTAKGASVTVKLAFARAGWNRGNMEKRIYLEFVKLPGYWIRYGVCPL